MLTRRMINDVYLLLCTLSGTHEFYYQDLRNHYLFSQAFSSPTEWQQDPYSGPRTTCNHINLCCHLKTDSVTSGPVVSLWSNSSPYLRHSSAIFQQQPIISISFHLVFPGGSDIKESACDAGNPSSIPGSGRSPGEGNGCPLQLPGEFCGLRGYRPWGHKSRTRLSDILWPFFISSLLFLSVFIQPWPDRLSQLRWIKSWLIVYSQVNPQTPNKLSRDFSNEE